MKKLAIILIFPLLISCAAIGINAPQTVEDKINLSVATLTGITKTVNTNLRMHLISVNEAEEYFKGAREAQRLVTIARSSIAEGKDVDALAVWQEINKLVLDLNSRYNKIGGAK